MLYTSFSSIIPSFLIISQFRKTRSVFVYESERHRWYHYPDGDFGGKSYDFIRKNFPHCVTDEEKRPLHWGWFMLF